MNRAPELTLLLAPQSTLHRNLQVIDEARPIEEKVNIGRAGLLTLLSEIPLPNKLPEAYSIFSGKDNCILPAPIAVVLIFLSSMVIKSPEVHR